MGNYIECENVSLCDKRNHYLLDHINLSLEKGKIYGIVGRNGSGKTMLFRAICGFWKANEGKIIVDGKEIGKDVEFIQNAGVSIGESQFIGGLSGLKNLQMLAEIRNKIRIEEILKTLEEVQLLEEKDKKYRKYSLGMKQKLRLAQAFMEQPDILILDEPFNGMDQESVKRMRQYLLEQKEKGTTILLASHIREDIDMLCDEIYQMDVGKLKKYHEEDENV